MSQLIPPVFLRAHSQALLNDLTTDKPRQQVIESRNLNRFSLNSLTQSVFHRISRLQCRYKTSPAFCGRKKKVRRWPTSSSSAPSSSSCRTSDNGIPWLAANVGGTVVSAFVCRRTFGSSRQRMNCFRLGPIDSPFDGSASRKAPEEEEIGKGRKKGGKKFGNLSKWRYYRTGRLVTRLSSPFIAYVVHRFSLKPFLFFHLLS